MKANGRSGVLALAVLAGIAVALRVSISPVRDASSADGPDTWQSGYMLEEWKKIEAVQRYPLIAAEPVPDWAALTKDASPLVRAAAMLGIGRTADTNLLPLAVAGLDDSSRLVRDSALWAVTQMETEDIKAPLLKVFTTWEDLTPSICGESRRPFGWTGLSAAMRERPLAERQRLANQFGPAAWDIRAKDTGAVFERLRVEFCVEASQFDADSTLSGCLRIIGSGGRKAQPYRVDKVKPYAWGAVTEAGPQRGSRPRGNYLWSVTFPEIPDAEGSMTTFWMRGEETVIEAFNVSAVRDLMPPGVYLVAPFREAPPVFVRLRRTAEMEERIPQLIEEAKSGNPASIETLGRQRVRAAVPALVEVFRKYGLGGDGGGVREPSINLFKVAGALATIGDARAVPVLLDYPRLRHFDLVGDTGGYLQRFGPLAYGECEKRLLDWRRRLRARHPETLKISIDLLGPDMSPEAKRALRSLLDHLLESPSAAEEARYVLASAIVAVARQDADGLQKAVEAIVTRPEVFRPVSTRLGHRAQDRALRVNLLKAVWDRVKDDPEIGPSLRHEVAEVAGRRKDELQEVFPGGIDGIGSPGEAMATLDLAFAGKVDGQQAAQQIEAFLRTKDITSMQRDDVVLLRLALLHYDLGDFDGSLERLGKWLSLPRQEPSHYRKVVANYYLGKILVARGRLDEAEQAFQRALSAAKPSYTYYGIPQRYIHDYTIRRELEYLGVARRVPGLRVWSHGLGTLDDRLRYCEAADGQAFCYDCRQRLCAFDPFTGKRAIILTAVLPRIRAFMPLDRDRVFVAFDDSTAALYERGRERPLWKRPFALGYQALMSASPTVITAVTEEGTFHALDSNSGATLWTKKEPGKLWPEGSLEGHRGLVRQHGNMVLMPSVTAGLLRAFQYVEASSGRRLWERDLGFPAWKISLGKEHAAFAGRHGEFAIIRLADGKLRLSHRFGYDLGSTSELDVVLAADDAMAFVAAEGRVWALTLESDREAWQWTWAPESQEGMAPHRNPEPRLLATDRLLFCLVGWEADVSERDGRMDVVLFKLDGTRVFHETSPVRSYASRPADVFVRDGALVFRRDTEWEVWAPQGALQAVSTSADREAEQKPEEEAPARDSGSPEEGRPADTLAE